MKTKQCQLSQAITKEDVQAVLKSERRHAVEFEVLCLDGNLVKYLCLDRIKFPVASVTVIMSDKKWKYVPKAGELKGSNRLKVRKRRGK